MILIDLEDRKSERLRKKKKKKEKEKEIRMDAPAYVGCWELLLGKGVKPHWAGSSCQWTVLVACGWLVGSILWVCSQG